MYGKKETKINEKMINFFLYNVHHTKNFIEMSIKIKDDDDIDLNKKIPKYMQKKTVDNALKNNLFNK